MERVWKKLLAIVAVAGLAGVAGVGIAADASRWSYAGATGPAKWAKLEKDFAACAQGKTQSPIDIPDAEARKGDLPPLLFDYRPSPLRIIDNGHTIQVNYAPGSTISVEGTRYELVEFHFHKPSEEKISGKGHDMEAHLVHREQGRQARRHRRAARRGQGERADQDAVGQPAADEGQGERRRRGEDQRRSSFSRATKAITRSPAR